MSDLLTVPSQAGERFSRCARKRARRRASLLRHWTEFQNDCMTHDDLPTEDPFGMKVEGIVGECPEVNSDSEIQ